MAQSKDVITQIRKATRRTFSADEKIESDRRVGSAGSPGLVSSAGTFSLSLKEGHSHDSMIGSALEVQQALQTCAAL